MALLSGCATTGALPPSETLSVLNAPEPVQPAAPVVRAESPAAAAAPPKAPAGPTRAPSTALQPMAVEAQAVTPTEAPIELWDRIRRGFRMPDLEGQLVKDREQWYASRPDYIQRMTERSKKYLFHIVEELEKRNMPTELALLPFIESAFNPQAVSSAKAAGMWQFMPRTGTYFELKQNVFRDDRRDVLASTRAALDYLQKLHGMFGDWHLALAAYNWGEGSVGRAIARNKRAGLGTSYTELNMPAETRLYVPKLQAVKNIVANPQNFQTELPLIENHPYFQEVPISRDIDVALAAKLADVKLEDFKALNPAASRPVILAAGIPQILLPWDNAKVFQRNFEAYTLGQYASWTTWTVPSTMSSAEAARRTGMAESDLRSVNSIPPRMLIKTGSTLLVPRSAKVENDVTSHVAENGHMSLSPETVTRRTTVKARKGETVATLAKRYRVSTLDVADWNSVTAHTAFKLGQDVVIYLPVKMASGKRGAKSKSAVKTKSAAKPAQKSKAPRAAKP
ncbi:MAG: transglycosylase SLT domain-containing protein [Polaromonas sp.]|nr:transglycosylase SLT domain-containing protein [Polaromonas sp.]